MSVSWTDALVRAALEREGVRLERLREEAERARVAIRSAQAWAALEAERRGVAGITQTIERAALREDVATLAHAQEQIQAQRARVGRLEETIATLRAQQHLDAVTGCLDRGAFDAALAREWSRGLRASTQLGLVCLDVDRFREVNERVGHQGGEGALRAIARAVAAQTTRPGELVGRVGGDALAILVPHADLAGALALGERVRTAVAELQLREGEAVLPLSVSVGVAAVTPTGALQPQELRRRADHAVARAKAAGRAQAVALAVEHGADVFYAPAPAEAHARSERMQASARGR